MTVPDELDANERAELERLRAEVAALRSQAAPTERQAAEPAPAPRRPVWRWVAVGVLLVLVGVFALGSVTTRFVRSQILDTDRYVATVSPIGSDPAVQAQVVDTITNEINSRVNVEDLTAQALTALTELTPTDRPRLDTAVVGLAPVIAGQAENFVRNTVSDFVHSSQFEDLWVTANRAAHNAGVAIVTGDTKRAAVQVETSTGTISIALGPIIDQVKARMVDRDSSSPRRSPRSTSSSCCSSRPTWSGCSAWSMRSTGSRRCCRGSRSRPRRARSRRRRGAGGCGR